MIAGTRTNDIVPAYVADGAVPLSVKVLVSLQGGMWERLQ